MNYKRFDRAIKVTPGRYEFTTFSRIAAPKKEYEMPVLQHCGGVNCPFEYSCIDSCVHPKSAPKKEEESQAQLLHGIIHNYREYQQDIKHGSQKSFYDFMDEELEKFEIKRKPL